jgi:hypothetical protein
MEIPHEDWLALSCLSLLLGADVHGIFMPAWAMVGGA